MKSRCQKPYGAARNAQPSAYAPSIRRVVRPPKCLTTPAAIRTRTGQSKLTIAASSSKPPSPECINEKPTICAPRSHVQTVCSHTRRDASSQTPASAGIPNQTRTRGNVRLMTPKRASSPARKQGREADAACESGATDCWASHSH